MSNLPGHIKDYEQINYQANKDKDATVYRGRGRPDLKAIDRLKNSRDLGEKDNWWGDDDES